jgi:hypothetical protein
LNIHAITYYEATMTHFDVENNQYRIDLEAGAVLTINCGVWGEGRCTIELPPAGDSCGMAIEPDEITV